LACLVLAVGIDLSGWKDLELAGLAEGIPKLVRGLNLALYFWDTCSSEIGRAVSRE
jgi:hypothetical protein